MEAGGPWEAVALPPHCNDRAITVEEAISGRRSVRAFVDEPIPLTALSGLLWAAQGVTSPDGLRAAPSAGALHPLALYLVAGRVDGLGVGVWRYLPAGHVLQPHRPGDCRAGLAHAAMRQHWLRDCAVVLVFAAASGRVVSKYGSRGHRYVSLEVGCAAENAWLQARSLGLDAAAVGAFVDTEVAPLVGLAADQHPLLLLGVGRRSEAASDDASFEV